MARLQTCLLRLLTTERPKPLEYPDTTQDFVTL
jgi:hypothetical protein